MSARPNPETEIGSAARTLADLIAQLPNQIKESFKGGRAPRDRVAFIQDKTTRIMFDALPFVGWLERRTHPGTALLEKQRIDFVCSEAVECCQQEIPEFVAGEPAESPGAFRSASLLATCAMVAKHIREWARDIETEQEKEDVDVWVPASEVEKLYGLNQVRLTRLAKRDQKIRRRASAEERTRWIDPRLQYVYNKRRLFELTEGSSAD